MSRKLTTEEFVKLAKNIHGDIYDYSNTIYEKNRKRVNILCKIHGEFWQYPSNHLQGNHCPKCNAVLHAQRIRKRIPSNTEFINSCIEMYGDQYDYSKTNYIDSRTKITVICRKHGISFFPVANAHRQGTHGCPKCKSSRGELFLSKLLSDLGIHVASQKTYSELVSETGYPLRYDFHVPKYNLLIEYDGALHFESSEFFGGECHLQKTQRHDKLKTDYAIANNIRLVRVNYKMSDNEIRQIIIDEIAKELS